MSENQPNNSPSNEPKPNWRDLREQERRERRAGRGNNGWIFGAVLIVVGAVLFFQNMNLFTLNNWWALFILVPGFGSLAGAWRMYTAQGELSGSVIGSLLAGLILVGVAAVFLLDLNPDWTRLLPALLILFGVSLLIPTILGRR